MFTVELLQQQSQSLGVTFGRAWEMVVQKAESGNTHWRGKWRAVININRRRAEEEAWRGVRATTFITAGNNKSSYCSLYLSPHELTPSAHTRGWYITSALQNGTFCPPHKLTCFIAWLNRQQLKDATQQFKDWSNRQQSKDWSNRQQSKDWRNTPI